MFSPKGSCATTFTGFVQGMSENTTATLSDRIDITFLSEKFLHSMEIDVVVLHGNPTRPLLFLT